VICTPWAVYQAWALHPVVCLLNRFYQHRHPQRCQVTVTGIATARAPQCLLFLKTHSTILFQNRPARLTPRSDLIPCHCLTASATCVKAVSPLEASAPEAKPSNNTNSSTISLDPEVMRIRPTKRYIASWKWGSQPTRREKR
jgi:hypothetical protein